MDEMNMRVRQEKVQKFEEFVDRRLKPNLVNAINQRDKVFEKQKILPETQHIFLDIGLGFHVELTLPEALEFISVREARLAKQIEEYTYLIANTKAQIKLVCEGIQELLQLPAAE